MTVDEAMARFRGLYNQMYCDLADCECPGCISFLQEMRELIDWVYMEGWNCGKLGGKNL